MTSGEKTDLELMSAIAQSNQGSLSQLYDRYARLLFSLAYKILGSVEESEEVVLDVFSQVWHHGDAYQPERGRVDTWLFTMARSRAIDRLRKRQRQTKIVDASTQALQVSETSQGEDSSMITERREQVQSALNQLPEEQRLVLELAYFGGLSKAEITTKINISVGTVKTRTRLGLKKLKGLLVA